jgi:hypothetical protein
MLMAASAGLEARGTSATQPAETDDSDPQPFHPDLFPRIRDSDRLPQAAAGSLALNQQYAMGRFARISKPDLIRVNAGWIERLNLGKLWSRSIKETQTDGKAPADHHPRHGALGGAGCAHP